MSPRARYHLFRLLGSVFEHLPEAVGRRVAEAAFAAVGRLLRARHPTLEANLDAALSGAAVAVDHDTRSRYVTRGFREYGRYWAEGGKLPALDRAEVAARLVIVEGEAHLAGAVAAGRGALLALPHVGSWEWGGVFLAHVGWPMTSVAERLEPEALYDWFVAKREAMGLEIVALSDAAFGPLSSTLRAGGVVGLLCDRDLLGTGVEVDLFGRRTTVPAGPAMLALRTGAALLATAVYSGPGRDHHVVVTPPIDTARRGSLRDDVARVSQAVTDELAGLIRRAPEQWHMFQPIFSG